MYTLLLLAFCHAVFAESSVQLGPLEWGHFSKQGEKFHVPASKDGPGSRELSAAAVSGDAIFLFGGQDESGYHDTLYALAPGADGSMRWQLLHGNKTTNSVGRYGTQKALSTSYYPSARSGACMGFITSSHALLFGGRGIDSHGEEGLLNDLWVSEDMTQWGWFAGTQKVNSPSVMTGDDSSPSGRWKHTCGSHFESKRFLVFGGTQQHPENEQDNVLVDDIWAYGETGWQFLGGGSHSEAPDYENKNPMLRNPGSRSDHSSVMVEDFFYTFGGQTVSVNPKGGLSEVMTADLWRFHIEDRSWFYVAGSKLANTRGAYPAAIGQGGKDFGPGARVGAAMTFNQLTNELYIFGGYGYGYASDTVGHLNDLWSFNTVNNCFYWLGGSSGLNSEGSLFPPMAPSARSSSLLFSGNDGLEQELTLIGGAGLLEGKMAGISEIWMVNVEVPVGFTIAAPSTTMPPATVETEPETTAAETTEAEATTKEKTTEEPTSEAPETDKPTKPSHTDEEPWQETSKPAVHVTRRRHHHSATGAADGQSVFDAGSPQKIAALVLGSFVAIIILVGGIVFLGFAFVSSSGSSGSRTVLEPYSQV